MVRFTHKINLTHTHRSYEERKLLNSMHKHAYVYSMSIYYICGLICSFTDSIMVAYIVDVS